MLSIEPNTNSEFKFKTRQINQIKTRPTEILTRRRR
jgi:hypothetical protein